MGTLLSPVLRESHATGSSRGQTIAYMCPGCGHAHMIEVEKRNQWDAVWRWDGNAVAPTITPTVNVAKDYPDTAQCHHYVTNGQIQYQQDCYHELRGTTVPMVPFNQEN